MDKFTRLLNLVALLQQSQAPLSFSEIRGRLRDEAYPQRDPESARRAFERDKSDLVGMGVALRVHSEPGDAGVATYSIEQRSARLADPGFTPEELGALHFAATAMSIRGRDDATMSDASDGLRKYGGLGGNRADRDLAEIRLDDNLTAAFAAILDRRPVGFTHGGRTRMLLPHQIAARQGRWYLRGFDLDASEGRTYRLDRVEGALLVLPEDVPEHTEDPGSGNGAPVRFRPWEFGGGDPLRAEVRLDTAAAAVALAADPDLVVVEREPGHTTVALEVRNPSGLWHWLLPFLERARLLSPPELVEQFRERLAAMAALDPARSPGSPADAAGGVR